MYKMYVKGREYDVLSIEQDKPYTMARVRHVNNGVIYNARGWALWDGTEKWSVGKGNNIAVKRARRKIERRLKRESQLTEMILKCETLEEFYHKEAQTLSDEELENFVLHRDGGTVQL